MTYRLKLTDRPPEGAAVARVLDGFFQRAFGQTQRHAGVEAALRVECADHLAKATFLENQIFQRQLAVIKANLRQIFAAHGVIARGAFEAGRAAFDQHASDAAYPRQFVHAGEHHKSLRLVDAADQRFDPIQYDSVALDLCVGAVVANIGAGMGFGHADGENDFRGTHPRQQTLFDALRRIGGNDPRLCAHFAHQVHGGHVTAFRDFF